MNNFRQYPPKSFGGRGPDLPNPWMTEEELVNIRRQNPQFHPMMPNINPNMHSPLLNQTGVLPMSNKNLMGQNSCKMSNSSFTNTPNPNIFKPPYSMDEPNYPNRFMGDRFSSYPPMNAHSKLNEGPVFKDFPASNMMSPLSHKNDRFSSVSKPLFSNVRQPQERLQCMQNEQSQFSSKYGSSSVFQGKDFPFSSLKDSPSQNSMSYNNKLPVSTGCNVPSFKPNIRTPNLFPAYTPKDTCETPQKSLTLPEGSVANASHSPYNSDFIGKSTFCDNPSIAPSYSKSVESFHEKESYQEKNIPVEGFSQANKSSFITDNSSTYKTMSSSPLPQDSYKTLPNTEASQDSYKNVQNSQVLHDSYKTMASSHMPQNSYKNVSNFPMSHDSYKPLPSSQISHDSYKPLSSSQMSHDSYKAVPNSQVSNEVFKGLETKVSSANSKYPYSSENQQACFQSSSDIPFQSSENVPFSFPSSTTSTTDCLLQTTPFSSQSDVNQTSKETFSNFNFESNINATDIADLLPGLDAFLKETVNKSEQSMNKPEDAAKNDFAKSTVPNCALSDDEWSKHSIPLIGENQFASNSGNNQTESVQQSVTDQVAAKEKCDKFDSVFEKPGDLKSTAVDQSNTNNQDKQNQLKNISGDAETSKPRSALEEAIDLLVTTDPIVGLDYIIEYKKNISQQGSFPFRCKLCNSAITRPSILDHIIGSKHRMRYLKTKDESKYEYMLSLKLEKADKDFKISEVAFQFEAVYGRGHVTVNTEDTPKAFGIGSSTWKESNDGIEESVFTLDKIPIGFEALSPQHDDIDPSDFTLDSDLSQVKQDNTFNITEKEISNKPLCTEVKNEVSKFDPGVALTDFCCEPSATTKTVTNATDLDNAVKNEVSQNSESDVKKIELSSSLGQVKRALSPDPSCRAKFLKSETSNDLKEGSETVTSEECSDVKAEDTSSETKDLSLDLLESLCQSEITTDDEASIVLKVINMLMQMLLRYKLQHLSLSKVENLMKSLQIKSPENIEELKSLLKDNKISDKILEDTGLPETKKILQVKAEENIELCLSHFENIDTKTSQSMNTVNNSASNAVSCAQMSQNLVSMSNITAASQTTNLYPCSMSQTSSNVASSSAPQIVNPQTANSGGLKPPPFFGWPQGNESMTNKVSYAPTQGNQSMMWTNAYQHSQPQFSQMPYYQPQNYGNTFGGTHAYQTQFSVMPQASMQISQPPLPPPPPIPPPPPPANPPLPPSAPFLHNSPSLPPYPKNQPLPPLP